MHTHHSPLNGVRPTRPRAVLMYGVNENTQKKTFKELLNDVFLQDLHPIMTLAAIFIFSVERSCSKSCVIGRLMVCKGCGSPPSLAPPQDDGSGWLTVRKSHLGVAGDTFIEPVKLTKSMSCTGTRVTITHAETHRQRAKGGNF